MKTRQLGLLLVVLTVGMLTQTSGEAPKERFWTLDCSLERPWLLVVNDPVGTTRYAWVVTFEVSNPTDKPVFYLPYFLITTDTDKLYRNVLDFAAEREAELSLGRELANVVDLIGPLAPGETRQGVATFPLPDPEAARFDLYAGGLSNAYKVLEQEGKSAIVRKMLLTSYHRPGDAYDLYLDKIYQVESRWVWR